MSDKKGFLFVMSEPGQKASLEEFHDWYDNEHVPLRLDNDLPEFLCGARYEAVDGQMPGWMASYETSNTAFFENPRYTRLRANRSPREADLVSRLETLDRRTASIQSDTHSDRPRSYKDAAPLALTCAFTPANIELFAQEYKSAHLELFSSVSSWRRSYWVHVYDSLLTGSGREPSANIAPSVITINEFDDLNCQNSAEYQSAINRLEAMDILKQSSSVELRTWKLYRAWPNTAHSN